MEFLKKHKLSFAVAGLLLISLAQGVYSAWENGQTTDETYYTSSGYAMVRHNNYDFLGEHPPLIMQIASLPLLLLQPQFDTQNPIYLPNSRAPDISRNGARFLYKMGNDPYSILRLQRLPIVLLMVLLGFVLVLWAREFAGATGALVALTLYVFDPNIIAHGSLLTSDLGLTTFYFIAVFFIKKLVDHPCARHAAWAGLFCGLTFCAKISGLVLFASVTLIFICFYLTAFKDRIRAEESPRFNFWAGALAIFLLLNALGQKQAMVAIGPVCLLMIYLCWEKRIMVFSWKPAVWIFRALLFAGACLAMVYAYKLKKKYGIRLSIILLGWNFAALVFTGLFIRFWKTERRNYLLKLFMTIWLVAGLVIILDYTEIIQNFHRFVGFGRYVQPLGIVLSHSMKGHHICIEGSFVTCDWKYFFWILGIKTPLLTLFLGLIGVVLLFVSKRSWVDKAVVLVPPAVFFGAATFNGIHIGLRHILPVYLFFFLWAAFSVSKLLEWRKKSFVKWALRGFLSVCLLGSVIRSLSFAPNYLTYFNEWIGGPEQGARLVSDSNLNWGQDNKQLAEFVKLKKLPLIIISSEAANPDVYDYHGIAWREMTSEEKIQPRPGYYALGIGVYSELQRQPQSWFLGKKPLSVVGKTIYIFLVPEPSSETTVVAEGVSNELR